MFLKSIGAIIVATVLLSNVSLVNWENNYELALKKAKEENRPVMLCFYTNACGYCKKLENETLSNAEVLKAIEPFVKVHINLDERPDLQRKYLIRGVPVVLFISASGKKDWMIGYRTPESFLQELNRFLEIMNQE